jgi:ACS family tartrate transporter-like MFS transporter
MRLTDEHRLDARQITLLCLMTDTPSKTQRLQVDERKWLIAMQKMEADAKQSHAGHTAGALSALRDPRVLALALICYLKLMVL